MAAAQLDEADNSGMAPCEEEADDYPMEEEEDDDFFVQLGATYWCRRADGSYRDGEVVKLRMNKRAGREEYLVHYVGLTRRQAEWVDKTRLMLSKPIKQEDMENGTDQKISEIGKAIQNQRSDEDKPEAKKAKLYTSAVVPKNKEITCLLCNELYKDPVMVQCGHSFCRSCINEAWANRDSVSCPDCSKVVTERNVTANFALAYILKTTVGDAVKPAEKVKAYSDVNCPKHDEKLKLYCMDDGILGCIICRDSLKHNGHTLLPIVDAVEMYQAKLSSVRNPLEEACKKSIELNVQQSEKVEQLQNTITECRQHIWSEFGNLYSFLKERKKNLLQQLQEQGPALLEELETYAAKLKQNRDSVKECMVVANKKMYETEPTTFLDGMEDFVMKAREQLEEVNLTLSGMRQKQLCRGTFNGPVQFFTWKQMKSIIPVADHEEQPEPPKQEEVPESSSDAAVINDSVPDNGEQPVPPRQEEVPESPMDSPVICNSVPECEKQPEQKEVSECPMDLPVIQENGAKEVWIIGNNYMTAVNQRAQDGLLDLNLGFKRETCTIHWFSLNNRCETFFGRLKDATRKLKPPDVLLFHSGYSDLSCSDFILLIKMVTTGLTKAANFFPNTQFILSALYPKIPWQEGAVSQCRNQFFATLLNFSKKPGFHLLQHEQLAAELTSRCLTEDVSVLKDDEIEQFILRIQNALQKKFPSATENYRYAKCSSGLFPPSEPAKASAEKVTRAKEVWILGNHYMTAVNKRAQDGLLDLNLGFKRETCTIRWLLLNNRCESFFGRLKDATKTLKPPDVLLFHSGYSDLSRHDFIILIKMVTSGLTKAANLFPNTQFILSALYPEIPLQEEAVKQCRERFYSTLFYFSRKPSFHLLQHNPLTAMLTSRSLTEDVSVLKDDEIELFILHIQNALQKNFSSVTENYRYAKCSSGLYPPSEPAKASAEKVTIAENVQQLAVAEKPEAPEAPADPSGPKGVWIVGDAFIYRAASFARHGNFGENIGFDRANWSINWMRSTNRWSSVLSDLHNVSCKQGMPSIMFLHIGSDELEVIQCRVLINEITYAIGQLVKLYPKTHFIFSTILPKAEWLSNIIDHNRMTLNKVIGEYVETLGVEVAKNARLETMLRKRFQLGRVNSELTLQENNVFLTDIRLVLCNAMLKVGKTTIEIQEPKKQVLHTGGTLTVVVPGADPLVAAEEKEEEEEVVKNSEPQPVTNEEVPSVPDSPALPNTSGVKQIWIVGNSYICRAARQANDRSYGSNMGLDLEKWKVNWFGRVAMRWEALLPELKHALSTFGAPSIIFVHLGDSDLGCMPYGTLTKAIAGDLTYLAKQFPKTEFIFSTIFPRAEWLTNPLEQNRKDVNIFLSKYAGELGFLVAVHDNVEEVAIPRFKSGGSNVISASEFNMFMNNIREGLEKAMLKVEKAICMTLVHQYSLGSV